MSDQLGRKTVGAIDLKPGKLYRLAIGAAACLASGQAFAATSLTYDITADNASALVDGAYFFQKTGNTASGTGGFSAFLAIKNDGGGSDPSGPTQAAGFNTDPGAFGDPLALEIDEDNTSDIYGSDLSVPTSVSGASGSFYQFGVDINEPSGGNQDYLSFDEFEIWVRSGDDGPIFPATSYSSLTGSGATKIYELDIDSTRDVTLLAKASPDAGGSGNADYLILVPQTKFTDVSGWDSDYYIFVWMMVGGVGTLSGVDYGENSDFDQIARVSGFNVTVPPPVPEAGTVAAVAVLTAFTLGHWYLRRRGKPAA